jgi:hypothetical protein
MKPGLKKPMKMFCAHAQSGSWIVLMMKKLDSLEMDV